ncbi:Hypothetical predicted protein [Olea europaea subsp. europaea]|uniref:Uncharacterized protein n=1 Tax=Olea europaea subsp. europaea TaxID=158383 RepID=A0A8S0QGK5_OLEEU|nr:Hypothetical predicted protein [Olea europaea subsp. europaea]
MMILGTNFVDDDLDKTIVGFCGDKVVFTRFLVFGQSHGRSATRVSINGPRLWNRPESG